MTAAGITAIVLTLNEERHLAECLESLEGLTDRVLVVDSGSTDRTLAIAADAGARTVYEEFRGFASQRNKALGLAADSEWVLFLDADERLTPALRSEILTSIHETPENTAGFWIPRRNLAFGAYLRGGGWWPDYQARVIRQGRGYYDPQQEVHEVVIFAGPTQQLAEPMIHINYESRREFLRQQRAYTLRRAEARQISACRRVSYISRPLRELVRRLITLRGYRDGTTGLFMACVMGLEEFRGCVLTRRSVDE